MNKNDNDNIINQDHAAVKFLNGSKTQRINNRFIFFLWPSVVYNMSLYF